MLRRGIAAFMVLAMTVGLLPEAALAAGTADDGFTLLETEAELRAITRDGNYRPAEARWDCSMPTLERAG